MKRSNVSSDGLCRPNLGVQSPYLQLSMARSSTPNTGKNTKHDVFPSPSTVHGESNGKTPSRQSSTQPSSCVLSVQDSNILSGLCDLIQSSKKRSMLESPLMVRIFYSRFVPDVTYFHVQCGYKRTKYICSHFHVLGSNSCHWPPYFVGVFIRPV